VEVRAEYQRAIDGQKSLIPIILDDTPLSVDLSQFQGIDMRPIIGDHRKDSIPISIDPGNSSRDSWSSNTPSFGPTAHGWKPSGQELMQNIHDWAQNAHAAVNAAEQRQKVFDEVARMIYDGIPDCIH
jgi:hypothetical protein